MAAANLGANVGKVNLFIIMQGIPRYFGRQSKGPLRGDRNAAQAAVLSNSAYY